MPQNSPCAPAAGDSATAGMPVSVFSQCASVSISSSAPCTVDVRLQRMDVGEARQPRHLLVEARVVLHRARAERVEAGVDRVVLLRQPREVAHRLRLATGPAGRSRPCASGRRGGPSTLRQRRAGRRRCGPRMPCSKISGSSSCRPRLPRDRATAPVGAGRLRASRALRHVHHSTSASAASRRSMSASVFVSVAATSSRFAQLRRRSDQSAATGTPARTPLLRQRARRRPPPASAAARELVEEGCR